MNRTISIDVRNLSSITHNNRTIHHHQNPNIDVARSAQNIIYCHTDIKTMYHQLFDASVSDYNQKQKRKDRRILDYYQSVKSKVKIDEQKEMIIAIGKGDDLKNEATLLNCDFHETSEWQKRKQALHAMAESFQQDPLLFPNLAFYNMVLHLDEDNPHLHVNFIPFTTKAKKGPKKQVSMNGALEEMGYNKKTNLPEKGKTREILDYPTNFKTFRDDLMHSIITHFEKSNSEKFNFIEGSGRVQHLSVQEYKKAKEEAQEASKSILTTAKKEADELIIQARNRVKKEQKSFIAPIQKELDDLKDEKERLRLQIDEEVRQWAIKKQKEREQIKQEKLNNENSRTEVKKREQKLYTREGSLKNRALELDESRQDLDNRAKEINKREAEIDLQSRLVVDRSKAVEQREGEIARRAEQNRIRSQSIIAQEENFRDRAAELSDGERTLESNRELFTAEQQRLRNEQDQLKTAQDDLRTKQDDFRAKVEASASFFANQEAQQSKFKARAAALDSREERFASFSRELTSTLKELGLKLNAREQELNKENAALKQREEDLEAKLNDEEVKLALDHFEKRKQAEQSSKEKVAQYQLLEQKLSEWAAFPLETHVEADEEIEY